MYVDASVMVAILAGFPAANALVIRLGETDERVTSVVSAFEAVVAVASQMADRPAASAAVFEFLEICDIRVVGAGGEILEGLAEAHLLYGKGSGHPAGLNIGDCFAYATARAAGLPILHEGEDFARTDLG